MATQILFEDAQLGYGPRDVVLRDVNLAIEPGVFWGVVGPNGSGKTTFLRTLLGLLRPVSGRVTLGSVRFGYVPQRDTIDTLFPIPVRDIVLMGRYGRVGLLRRPGAADRAAAEHAMEQVGIAGLAHRDYAELSGGQRQRALIARALATQPDLLVLDEPTHGMDLPSEHSLLELVRQLQVEQGLTVVLVSHLLGSVADAAQSIAIISNGRLDVGAREEVLTEEHLTRLYGTPVEVINVRGRTAVWVGKAL